MPVSFYANNFLVPGLTGLSATSTEAGTLSGTVEAKNRGSAVFRIRGTYNGTINRLFRVVIPDASVQQFVWSNGGAFSAPVTINLITQPWHTLSHGLECNFATGGFSPQFVSGDEWRWQAIIANSITNLMDYNRDSEFRTGTISAGGGATIFMDLGVAATPQALIIGDHNTPAGTNVALSASVNPNMSPLNVNQSVTWTAGHIRHVISGTHTYRYWAVTFNTLPVQMPYIRVGELYLGTVSTLSLPWTIGYEDQVVNTGQSPDSVLMRGMGGYGFETRRLRLRFDRRRSVAGDDAAKLDAVWHANHNAAALAQQPFWIHANDVPSETILELVHWLGPRVKAHQFLDRFDVEVPLQSVIRTAA